LFIAIYIYKNISPISSQNEKYFRRTYLKKSIHTFYTPKNLFKVSFRLQDKVKKIFGIFRYAKDENKIKRLGFACRMIRATSTQSNSLKISFPV